jgi:hypothetical protein
MKILLKKSHNPILNILLIYFIYIYYKTKNFNKVAAFFIWFDLIWFEFFTSLENNKKSKEKKKEEINPFSPKFENLTESQIYSLSTIINKP